MTVNLFQFSVQLFLLVVFAGSVYGGDFCMDHAPSGAVDGCSVPLLHFDYEAQFTPSCNKHDVCYDCVRTLSQYFAKLIHIRLKHCNAIVNC